METSEEIGWVTDPDALTTIIALNGIQPGDRVRVAGLMHSIGRHSDPIGGTVTSHHFSDGGHQHTPPNLELLYKVDFGRSYLDLWIWKGDTIIGWKPRAR